LAAEANGTNAFKGAIPPSLSSEESCRTNGRLEAEEDASSAPAPSCDGAGAGAKTSWVHAGMYFENCVWHIYTEVADANDFPRRYEFR
jgi:hypothetical protein